MKSKRPVLFVAIFFLAYLLICLTYSGKGYNDQYNAIISVATILFGIFIAFSIYNNQTKLTRVKELLRSDDANIISLYKLCSIFGAEDQKKLQSLLDEYMIAQVDYKLVDYHHSSKQFANVYDFILTLEPSNNKKEKAYESMLEVINSSFENRKLTEAVVQQRMTYLEWVSLISLEIVIGYIILTFNDKALVPSILSSLLVTTGFALIIVLRRLDTLKWQENSWIWVPLSNLFISLDLLPYYPYVVLHGKRDINPEKGKIRVCHYENPYPDMSNKKIEIVEVS